ncbi:MAG: aminotransferase class V-fold PLP-dependent enzyme [Myxococcota bacterium]
MEPLPSVTLGDRTLFPALDSRAYLNHAAISPPSSRVQAAVATLVDDYAAKGLGALHRWLDQREGLRDKLATLVGSSPDELGYVANTTAGVRAMALCIPWQARDRVVLLNGEFPANVTPWQQAAQQHDLRLTWLETEDFRGSSGTGLQRLEQELAAGVRLVAVSAVQFQTGLRMPLREIGELCRRYGAELFVDAIQACGAVPIDVEANNIDYLSCGSHKWLMGLEGVAFLYIRRSAAQHLRPVVAGWLSHEDGLRFLFEGKGHLRYDRPIRRRADLVEGGAAPGALLAALEAGLDPIATLGVSNVFEHLQGYLEPLERGLVERGFTSLRSPVAGQRSGILSVDPPADIDLLALSPALGERRIHVSTPDGRLRFAPHWPNGHHEVPVVLDAVDDVMSELRRAL